jgi:hypothetical protein
MRNVVEAFYLEIDIIAVMLYAPRSISQIYHAPDVSSACFLRSRGAYYLQYINHRPLT